MVHDERLFSIYFDQMSYTMLQELQVEKQKTNRVEAVVREQRAAMEKELGNMQAKAQGNFQELQNMQMKVRAFICFHICFSFPVALARLCQG